jgi:glycosyltransferase involved in cell wall biosynthesis
MLAALPVAATGVSAVPEVVADGETGLLVAPGDAAALSGALDALLGDAALRKRLGEAGLDRARRRFSVARMADRTLALYGSL